MAELRIEGTDLLLRLSTLEKAGAMHGDIRLPLTSVVSAKVTSSVWKELRGYRAPGTGLPGVIALCTLRAWPSQKRAGNGFKDFAAVYGRGTAVIVELDDAEFDRLIVTVKDPVTAEELAKTLSA